MGICRQAIFTVGCVLWAGLSAAHCAPDHVHVQTERSKTVFAVELAQTPEDRQTGLMFVEHMPMFSGMLFIFDTMAPRAFWMQNTLISLDIIFVDDQGQVVNIAKDAVPGDLTSLPSDGPAQFVLEINAGLSSRLGIEPGSVIRHPLIGNAKDHAICVN